MSGETTGDYAGDVPIVIRGNSMTVAGYRGERLWDVLRRLVPQYRDLLLADEQELRDRIPADLPEILRLDEWHQPDFPGEDSPPSDAEVYQQLADVLASGDITRRHSCPTHTGPTGPNPAHCDPAAC